MPALTDLIQNGLLRADGDINGLKKLIDVITCKLVNYSPYIFSSVLNKPFSIKPVKAGTRSKTFQLLQSHETQPSVSVSGYVSDSG